uniref:Uncharacterized protein n=1 Tax=Arundo donax TaxID=35708 RepID=A0A0A9DIB9_ARUDO
MLNPHVQFAYFPMCRTARLIRTREDDARARHSEECQRGGGPNRRESPTASALRCGRSRRR